jgi:hypothetical protein
MYRALSMTLSLTFAATLAAQTYRVGTNYSPLYLGDTNCQRSWWDPDIYPLPPPSNDLRVVAQGGNPWAVCPGGISANLDSIYAATRAAATGTWTVPTTTSCPLIRGAYTRCGFNASTPGPLASPSVVKVDDKYYMAFSGGNADNIRGHIYWAVSTDGDNWSIWTNNPEAGDTWSSIVRPLNPVGDPNNGCKGPDPFGTTNDAVWSANGVGQLSLVYDSGWFYVFFNYFHQPLAPNYVLGSIPPVDMMAYRFTYNSTHPYGFGTSKQIWHNRQWVNISSGNFLNWSYSGNPQFGTDPVLVHNKTMSENGWANRMEYGAGDLKYDQDRGWWVWIYTDAVGEMWWQKTQSLSAPSWSPKVRVDHMTLADPSPQMPGIWRGTLTGPSGSVGPRWWTWVPANTACGHNSGFFGLALVPAQLNYP